MAGAGETPFRVFVELVERIEADKRKYIAFLELFFKKYGWGDFYAVYRLLLPLADKDRRSYQMKEMVIAKLYVEALAIEPNSEDGQVCAFFFARRADVVRRRCSSFVCRWRVSKARATLARQCTGR
jgi:hypothetical protein